ncbi:MAG: TPM domain-containing protein, partial [Sphingobacteriales bacterium]
MFKKYIVFVVLFLFAAVAFAQELPEKPTTLVNDYAGVLSAADKQSLEDKVVAFDDSTSTQIAIVLVKTLGDQDVAEYALKLGRKWGVGHAGKNNGIMILAAIDDRKLTIQTGYGVEGAIPDAITRQIRENDMNPRFREGDYYGGLNAAVEDIIKYTKGEFKAEAKPVKKQGKGGPPVIVIIIVIVVLILVFSKRGGGGGGGQIIGRRGSASPFWWLLAGNMLGGGGRSSGGDWGGFSGGGGGGGGFGG